MTKHEFEAILIRPEGVGTWTYLDIPARVSIDFGAKGQVRVRGSINGHSYRTSARPHGDGGHYIVVNKSIRDAIGMTAGDLVHVEMDLDDAPRTVEVPPDFIQAMKSDSGNSKLFNALSYSRRKEFVDWIESAKREDTRERRIAQSLEMLLEGTSPKSPKK